MTTPTIDVGRWRCGCGGWLDLAGKPQPDCLLTRCNACQRTFRIVIVVHEVVTAE